MSVPERTVKAAAWTALGTAVQAVVSLVGLAIIARILGPEAFGVTAAAWVVIGVVSVVITMSFNESLFNHENPEPGHYDAIFWLLFVGAVLSAGVIVLLRHEIAWVMGIPELAWVLPVSVLVLPFAAASTVQESRLVRELDMRAITHAGNAGATAASLTGTAAALLGFGLWSLVVMPIVNIVVRLLLILPATRWVPGFQGRWHHVRELGGFGLTVAGIRLAEFGEKALPRAIIGSALGAEALGYYSLAWRFFEQLSTLLKTPMTRIAMPAVARLRSDMAKLRSLLRSANRFVSVVAMPCFAGLLAIAPVAVPLLVGPQWVPSGVLLQVFCVIGLRTSMGAFQNSVMRGVGRPGDHLFVVLTRLVLAAVVTPLAATFGVFAVAASAAARHLLEWPLAAALVARSTGDTVWSQFRVVLPALAAAVVMALGVSGAIVGLGNLVPPLALLVSALPLGVLLYVLALIVFAPAMAKTLHALVLAGLRRDGKAIRAVARGI